METPSDDIINLNCLLKGSRLGYGELGLRLQHLNLGGDTIQPVTVIQVCSDDDQCSYKKRSHQGAVRRGKAV